MTASVTARNARQPDLFGAEQAHPAGSHDGQADARAIPAIPGLAVAADAITCAEERALIDRVEAAPLAPFRYQQWEGRRLTHAYGWSYDFVRGQVIEADPLPGWLLPLRARAARFAALDPAALVQALLIRYDPGATIGWHRDRPMFDDVIGLSLGTPATLRLRRRIPGGFARANAPLAPRAFYHLAGEVRHAWEHSIAALPAPRWSITFRSLAAMAGLRAG